MPETSEIVSSLQQLRDQEADGHKVIKHLFKDENYVSNCNGERT